MTVNTNNLHRIAAVKRDLIHLHDIGDRENDLFCCIPSAHDQIRVSFSLTADLQTVRCVAGTVDPIEPELREHAQRVIALNNEWLAVPLDQDVNGRLYTFVSCPFEDFVSFTEVLIALTMLRPATTAVFNALSVAQDIAGDNASANAEHGVGDDIKLD